jgi:hypothetical protein
MDLILYPLPCSTLIEPSCNPYMEVLKWERTHLLQLNYVLLACTKSLLEALKFDSDGNVTYLRIFERSIGHTRSIVYAHKLACHP